jgi:hypothetical protein
MVPAASSHTMAQGHTQSAIMDATFLDSAASFPPSTGSVIGSFWS